MEQGFFNRSSIHIGFLPPRGRGEARGHPAAESGHCTLATLRDTLLPKLLSGAAKELLK
jgi:hypothetical protein